VTFALEELLSLAGELSESTAQDLRYPISDLSEGQYVAELCGLKMRRLLIGGVCLVAGGCEESLGLLVRSTYEFWLIGTYALIGGDEALKKLNSHFHRTARLALGKELADELELPPGDGINVEDLAREVEGLLVITGIEHSAFPRLWYEHNYRKESGMSVHGGLFGLRPHYVSTGDDMIVTVNPETDAAVTRERLAAMITMLASLVSHLTHLSGKGQSEELTAALLEIKDV
jgi:hypothetical protein